MFAPVGKEQNKLSSQGDESDISSDQRSRGLQAAWTVGKWGARKSEMFFIGRKD